MVLGVKLVISQINVAKKRHNKVVVVWNTKQNIELLSLIWRAGLIFGFKATDNLKKCFVFLKQASLAKAVTFKAVKYFKKLVDSKYLSNLLELQPSIFCIGLTSKGLLLHKELVALGFGGVMFALIN